MYERYISSGKRWKARGKQRASSIYHSLPRNLKKVPIVEVLVGSRTKSVHDAVFDVDLTEEAEEALLEDLHFEEDEEPALRSLASRDRDSIRFLQKSRPGVRTRTPSSRRMRIDTNVPPSPTSGVPSPEPLSPRRQRKDTGLSLDVGQGNSGFFNGGLGVSTLQGPKLSPLARLFSGPRFMSPTSEITVIPPDTPMPDEATDNIGRIENALEEIRNLPVQKLKDEMKELQVSNMTEVRMLFERLINPYNRIGKPESNPSFSLSLGA